MLGRAPTVAARPETEMTEERVTEALCYAVSRCHSRSRCVRTATPNSATSSRTTAPHRPSTWRRSPYFPTRSPDCSPRSTNVSGILRLRFGLDRGEPRTLEEVGAHFHLTRERIRQIEARAMSKLRHPSSDTGARDLLAV